MALKKKVDPLDEIKTEAEENGINLSKAANGTYASACEGHMGLDSYEDPRALLDDQLAIVEMDGKDGLYLYDNADLDDGSPGYSVAVTGGETFTDKTLAGAFAKAKESLLAKPKRGKTTDIDKTEVVSGEVLEPVKPKSNGIERMQADTGSLAKACLDMAKILTDLAGTLANGPAVPFVADFAETFDEDSAEPPPARSRIKRERKQKEA